MRSPVFIENDLDSLHPILQHIAPLLRGHRIFLTGGTGFFGKWLLYSFMSIRKAFGLDIEMTVLTRDSRSFFLSNPEFKGVPGLAFINGDVRSFDIPPHTFNSIIHAATPASASMDRDHPDEMYSIIVDGTRHILDMARQCETTRLLYISSGAVYGPQPSDLNLLPESYEGEPATAYGRGKKESEHLCQKMAEGRFVCTIARPFAFVGPYLPLDTHFAVGNFILDCLENRPVVIQGDGTPLRSYLYAADLAVWLWTILLQGQHARAYNVGSDEAISIHNLATLVRACTGSKNDIIVQTPKKTGVPPSRYVPSIERARTELKLVPMCPLDKAILKTFQWHLKNRS
jgi:nucleoside-diphosphate-sugar epimerase